MKGAALGILLLAHGGDPSWNREVQKLAASVGAEAALGMADPNTIRPALEKLEKRGVKKIVAVPLFVNSSSEVLEQTRYVLGLKKEPSEVMRRAAQHMPKHLGHHMFSLERATTKLPLEMTPALDAHPLVAEILKERADRLGAGPVVLVAHGPVDEKSVPKWESAMRALAARLGREDVEIAMLRDDAPPPVRAKAVEDLRKKVAARPGAVVVPLLIARGGIEKKIPAALKGLEYRWDGRTLMPHPNIEAWVKEMTK